ncbi:hypothetical protein OROMI_031310 [Orobanche minor]
MSTSMGFVHRWANSPPIAFPSSSYSLPVPQSVRGLICRKIKVLKSIANTDTVVASDDSYGRKEVISINPRLYDYLVANVREPQILRELREETASMRGSQMQVSPDQAQLLAILVQILGAERCIEVGVYTGYSSLAVALILPEGGHLIACERDAESLKVAQKYYDRAGVSKNELVKSNARDYDTRMKALLFLIIEWLIDPARNQGKIRSEYLQFVENLEEVDEYAWGAALLSSLYFGLQPNTNVDGKPYAGRSGN